jgi:DNA-binding transcriptional regulator/RsmH inhibitor MraZ
MALLTARLEAQAGASARDLDDDKSRLFTHFIVSETTALEIDRSGQSCVPWRLRELAGIDDESVVISMYDRLEIWSLGEWNSSLARNSVLAACQILSELV